VTTISSNGSLVVFLDQVEPPEDVLIHSQLLDPLPNGTASHEALYIAADYGGLHTRWHLGEKYFKVLKVLTNEKRGGLKVLSINRSR
jgi:hypothetical protein